MSNGSLVCELGCGLGIISTLLQSKNIRCIATDICPDACYYAGYNIQGYNSFASTICLDWRKIPFSASFDFIVGADILYEQRWIPTVLDFSDATLKAGGKAIFADPQRNWWPVFKQAALDRNYTLEVVHNEKINDNKTHVELLCVTKKTTITKQVF